MIWGRFRPGSGLKFFLILMLTLSTAGSMAEAIHKLIRPQVLTRPFYALVCAGPRRLPGAPQRPLGPEQKKHKHLYLLPGSFNRPS